MLNKDLFQKDPTTFNIPNDGVTTVKFPETPEQWNVLRYELRSFVCEGQYRTGLERILQTYLANLGQDKQPAAWVSGFYGSGKSHLVRVLEHYWRNLQFPDGSDARNLSDLPTSITDNLRELSTAGTQRGGLWAAAGRLSSGSASIRLDMLRIVLESAGLPSEYAPARFVLWLKRKGFYDAVVAGVEQEGVRFDEELRDMYVSPLLAESLLAANPGFAGDQLQARDFLSKQFPEKEEISNAELVDTVRMVLELQSNKAGSLPCTLLAFDEVQQAIDEKPDRALEVQSIIEDLSSEFGTNLLVVGTGQSAVQATPQLQKLQGRFTVRVELSDRDVEHVVREVVLRKDQSKVKGLKEVLEGASGEIDRHLQGTRIAATSADKEQLVPDYPLLPTRRRFWEQLLRAIDTGTAAQLRTQLRMVHEATREVANQKVGTVVGGDFIYEQQKPAMLQSGVLLGDLAAIIEAQNDGTDDGELRSRLCATTFLIAQLPRSGALESGVRADADTLADLLVGDLPGGSSGLRQRVPILLEKMVDESRLMRVEGEYLLQTAVGAEWEGEYRRRFGSVRNDTTRIASDRAAALRQAVDKALKGVKLLHGENKTPRKLELHFGLEAPATDTTAVPVWIRDEWMVSEKAVRDDAQAAGTGSPIVFVLLPRLEANELTDALAAAASARATLDSRPSQQSTPEGMQARKSMETRLELAEGRVEEIVAGILRDARVYQGGGNEVVGESPAESVQKAAENALVRLFPEFEVANVAGWGTVVRKASQGAPDALEAIQYEGNVDQHPAARAVLDFVGGGGKKGSEIRAEFTGPGYGWPQDAVDGLLYTLLNATFISAKNKSGEAVSSKQIKQNEIGVTAFRREGFVLSAAQRIQLRKLAQDAGLTGVKQGEEPAAVQRVLQHLNDLAEAVSGPAPLPATLDTSHIEQLMAYSGNEQLAQVHEQRDTLLENYRAWSELSKRKSSRLQRWQLLEQLLKHATGLPAASQVRDQVEAIQEQRSLLDDVDPVKPLLDTMTGALRAALQHARQKVVDARDRELAAIRDTDEWDKLSDSDWTVILGVHHLGLVEELDLSSDERLLESLNNKSLNAWATELEAIPTRIRQARDDAAKRLAPQAVRVRPKTTTLEDEAAVDAYLEELRQRIMSHIEEGKPVIISLS